MVGNGTGCDNEPMRLIVRTLCVVVVLTSAAFAQAPAPAVPRELAITIDDLPQNGPEYGLKRMQRMTERLVAAVARHHIPAVAFVNEAQLYKPGEVDARIALLEVWANAGLELGNHTFAHKHFHETTLQDFEDEVIRGETVTRTLDAAHGHTLRFFRHPYLDTGGDLATRTAFETFLAARGYTIAPVTLDADDWMFTLPYSEALGKNDRAEMRRIADAYLAFTDASIARSEQYSQGLFGRQIRQVLLMHANELNADVFDDVVRLFEKRGYTFVPLDRALEDPAYREPNTFGGSNGITWFDRWAFTRGVKLDLPEIEPPDWVQQGFDRLSVTFPPRIPGSVN